MRGARRRAVVIPNTHFSALDGAGPIQDEEFFYAGVLMLY